MPPDVFLNGLGSHSLLRSEQVQAAFEAELSGNIAIQLSTDNCVKYSLILQDIIRTELPLPAECLHEVNSSNIMASYRAEGVASPQAPVPTITIQIPVRPRFVMFNSPDYVHHADMT
jgi:hypothetical protein